MQETYYIYIMCKKEFCYMVWMHPKTQKGPSGNFRKVIPANTNDVI